MSNERIKSKEAFRILQTGSEEWNQWRSDNPDVLVDFEGFSFPRNYSFRNVEFSNVNFSRANFEGVINFNNCVFLKSVRFININLEDSGLLFSDCVFESDISIYEFITKGSLAEKPKNFELSDFCFIDTVFKKNIHVIKSIFVDIDFVRVVVEGDLVVRDSTHLGRFKLVDSEISGEFRVLGDKHPQKFEGIVKVQRNQFNSSVNFENVSVEGPFVFESSAVKNVSLLSCKFLSKVYSPYFVRSRIVENLDLAHTMFSRVPDFRFVSIGGETIFLDTKANHLSVDNDCLASELESKNDSYGWNLSPNIREELHSNYDHLRFSKLKILAGEDKNGDFEKIFFINELKAKRGCEHRKILWFFNIFYDYFGGSGFYSHKPLATLFGLWIIFACIFQFSVCNDMQLESGTVESWRNSFLFSASNLVPFLASAGDMYQDSKSMLFSVNQDDRFPRSLYIATFFENVFGIVLVFLFGLTLRNRFRI